MYGEARWALKQRARTARRKAKKKGPARKQAAKPPAGAKDPGRKQCPAKGVAKSALRHYAIDFYAKPERILANPRGGIFTHAGGTEEDVGSGRPAVPAEPVFTPQATRHGAACGGEKPSFRPPSGAGAHVRVPLPHFSEQAAHRPMQVFLFNTASPPCGPHTHTYTHTHTPSYTHTHLQSHLKNYHRHELNLSESPPLRGNWQLAHLRHFTPFFFQNVGECCCVRNT